MIAHNTPDSTCSIDVPYACEKFGVGENQFIFSK